MLITLMQEHGGYTFSHTPQVVYKETYAKCLWNGADVGRGGKLRFDSVFVKP
jgi:hypothetical protein